MGVEELHVEWRNMHTGEGSSPAPGSALQPVNDMLDAVGPRLREIRSRRGFTLAEVADLVGVSVSTLSRLESGGRRPTLDLLVVLAQIYRLPLDDLVGAPATGDPRIHPKPVHRDGRIYLNLTTPTAPVQAVKQILPGRKPGTVVEQRSHGGYEWLYVLTGPVDLALGDSVTTLLTGEAAEFDTRQPHGVASASTEPTEVLILVSKHGELVHVRGIN